MDGSLRRPPAPPRPASIELASAILIVGGIFGIVEGELGPLGVTGAASVVGFPLALGIVLYGASILIGIRVRTGMSWVVALNMAAIYAFLYATGLPDPVALVSLLVHLYVVGALVARRPWFDAMREWRVSDGRERPDGQPEEDATS